MSTLIKYSLILKIALLLVTSAPSTPARVMLVDDTPPVGTDSDEDSPDVGLVPWDFDQLNAA